jgi:small subunit ribosomal protein S9
MAKEETTPKAAVPPAAPAPVEQPAPAAAAPAAPEAPKAEKPAPVEEVSLTAPPLPEGAKFIFGTGRRKEAVARVRIRPGTGSFLVNKKPLDKYFVEQRDLAAALSPLRTAKMVKSYDIWVNVDGGGRTGQSCAVRLGLARALIRAVPDAEAALRDLGLLTRDARMKERKKYGQKGARKRFQYSKR